MCCKCTHFFADIHLKSVIFSLFTIHFSLICRTFAGNFDITMLQFISFGSGSCGNCSLLTNGRDSVLIDAGVGIRQLKKFFREYGVKTQIIRGILITHDHTDHTKAAGYVSADYGFKVYATNRVHEGMLRNYHTTRKVDAHSQAPFGTGAWLLAACEYSRYLKE